MALGVAGQFLREGNQFLPPKRGTPTNLFEHPHMIARSQYIGNLDG